jgi:hypothetical protein
MSALKRAIGPLGGALSAASDRMELNFPICNRCQRNWLFSEIVFAVFAIGGFVGFPYAGLHIAESVWGADQVTGLYGGVAGLLVYLVTLVGVGQGRC